MGLRGKTVLYLGLLIFLSLTTLGVYIYWQGQKIVEKSTLDLINKEMAEKGHTLRKNSALVGMVIVAFSLIPIIGFVSRYLIRPILRLSEVAQRMIKGDFAARVDEESGKDEFKILYHAFNAAADFQQNAREKLEKEIAAQTAELTSLNIGLNTRAQQQAAVAELGQDGLAGRDLHWLMEKAVIRIAEILDVEYSKVLELLPDGDGLLLVAGVGWKEGCVGSTTIPVRDKSQAGYTLISDATVIVEDLRTETRFSGPPLLTEHGVVSGMSVIIHGKERPYGVLGAHTTRRRVFTQDDIYFFQAMANILSVAMERKQAGERLHRLNYELEQANRHKSDFLTNMSHELRTPLTAIIGFSELFKDGLVGELTSKQKEYLTDIFTSGHHLLSLINEILDLSKIEAGAVALNLEKMNIPLLLENSFVMVQEKALAYNITLDLKVEGIDQAYVDERKFKQIVYNLLSNAVEFTPDGGKVGIICRPEDEYIYLEIWDTGIGITEKDMKKLFRPFSQLDYSPARKHEGTGLGLAIVKNLVELHGGYVEVKSEAGKGSRFIVRLPYRKEVVGA